jgi:hypothetical protein
MGIYVDLRRTSQSVDIGNPIKGSVAVFRHCDSGLSVNFLISEIGIIELADSSLTLSIQPWVAVVDMVSARDELYKAIVERFRASKLDILFL